STSTIRRKAATSTTCRTPRARPGSRSRCRTRSASAAPTAPWSSAAPDAGGRVLVTRSLDPGSDLPALQRLAPGRYPLLLESSAAGTAQGRWDLLLAATGESLELAPDGTLHRTSPVGAALAPRPTTNDFLAALDADWQALRVPREEPRWPFRGGWAPFLAYEPAAQVEPGLPLPGPDE